MLAILNKQMVSEDWIRCKEKIWEEKKSRYIPLKTRTKTLDAFHKIDSSHNIELTRKIIESI